MELGLGPLVGRAMSRGTSGGSYGLRKSLGSVCAVSLTFLYLSVSPIFPVADPFHVISHFVVNIS